MSKPSVSDLLVEILANLGVRQIFGIPGDAINGLVEAIRKQDVIEFIQVRHEETGAFAASAQAKLSGRLGVCVGTAGPGAIHLLNGLYDAKLDHAPVLAITGQVATQFVGTDYHQEVDLYTLFKDVAAFNQVIMSPEQVPALLLEACQTALAERAPVHLSLPVDIAGHVLDGPAYDPRVFQQHSTTVPNSADIKRAAGVLNQAQKVVVFAGIGARGARDELIATAETLGAPIVRSLRGKTVLPDEHPLALGGIGLLGGKPGVQALEKCDAFLLVGTDFPYRDFYPRGIPAVQIDMDPTHLGKRCPVTVGLAGDAAPTLKALTGELRRKTERGFLEACQLSMRDWLADMHKAEYSNDKPIRPQRVARAISDLARDDAIFLCDTGTVTVWGARNLHLRGDQQFTLSASLASMAFGLPAAIGAQLAYPDRQVIALAGDGGFGMLMADFLTAVKYKLPITVVVFNNGKLGLIQVEQETEGLPNFQTSLHNPDFAEYARLCGGEGFHVSDPGELEPALKKAFASSQACVVDVMVNPDELPMPPKIMWDRMLGYGVAKVKELLGA